MRNLKKFFIKKNTTIKSASNKMSKDGNRCLIVVDDDNSFLGTLSTGDIRKFITNGNKITSKINDVYQKNPFFIRNNTKIKNYKNYFIKKKLDLIPVINESKKIIDIITNEKFLIKKKKINKKNQNYSVIIMAGGKGTRLAPFTHVLPKPLIPVNKKTLIEHIFFQLKKNGIKNINISVNYKSKTLIAFLEEMKKTNFKINFIKEKKPLGTIGILRKTYKNVKKNILITNCDTIIKCDYNQILKHHVRSNFCITLVLANKKQRLPYGACEINRNSNELVSLSEKPNISYVANTGFFFLKKEIIKLIPKGKFYNATDLIRKCLLKGKKIGVFLINEKKWLDVGQWKEYEDASNKLKIN